MVKHVTKDGTKRETMEGIIIRREDVPKLYDLLNSIRRKGEDNGGTDARYEQQG